MGLTLLDTSAVVGYVDSSDAFHHDAVEQIEACVRGGSGLALSVVSWTELLHGAFRGHRDDAVVRDFVDDFGVRLLSVDPIVAEWAAVLQARHAASATASAPRKLRTPDALILASAEVASGVERVVGADASWVTVTGLSVEVVQLRSGALSEP